MHRELPLLNPQASFLETLYLPTTLGCSEKLIQPSRHLGTLTGVCFGAPWV